MVRLNPLNDLIFMAMLGKKGCEPQLQGLLNAFLCKTGRDRLSSVEIIEHTTLPPEIIGAKKSVLDVRAQLADRTKVNIEVQLANEYNIDKRSLFYWSREYSQSIVSGQDYRELPQVIVINILGFRHFPLERYHTSFHLREDQERDFLLTDALEMHFLDLTRYRELAGKDLRGNPEHRWMSFLDAQTPQKEVEELIKMDEGIAKAQAMMDVISRDPGLLHAYHLYEMTLSDETSFRNGIREDMAINEVRARENEVKARENEIRAREIEVKARENEAKARENEVKAR
ncbi:MAG: Rpn family recombination-promoting nuclease/putative transposase [Spirochaetaceae bacterium]|jgi:predicted transposase/invertase (TIGR01784 family)|nr:Rpn family recombination-promoting nuclease/putative transposase [Spirochaetaceae bacterium]